MRDEFGDHSPSKQSTGTKTPAKKDNVEFMQDDFEDGDNDMLPVDNDALSFVEKSSSSCSLEGTPQDKVLLSLSLSLHTWILLFSLF